MAVHDPDAVVRRVDHAVEERGQQPVSAFGSGAFAAGLGVGEAVAEREEDGQAGKASWNAAMTSPPAPTDLRWRTRPTTWSSRPAAWRR